MNYLYYLINISPKYIYFVYSRDYFTISSHVIYLTKIISLLYYHINYQYKLLMDIVGVDYPKNSDRFQLIYNLLSINYGNRCFVKINVNEITSVPSLLFIYPNVSWYERECWDLYGIHFINNMDLRRILTDYGFSGHPLRKDFPLSGYNEVVFSEKRKNIMYKPVSLIQDFRVFETAMPWNYYWHFENPQSKD